MRSVGFLLPSVFLLGCAGRGREEAPQAAPAQREVPPSRSPPRQSLPDRDLVVASVVRAIEAARGERESFVVHTGAAVLLRSLADLIAIESGGDDARAEHIRAHARSLELAPPASADGAGLLKAALGEALAALEAASQAQGAPSAEEALAALDAATPLVEQPRAVFQALCKVGRFAAAKYGPAEAAGRSPVCDDTESIDFERPEGAAVLIAELRAHAHRLSRADGEEAAAVVAELLEEFAEVFAAGGASTGAAELRARLRRLLELDPLSLERTDRLKAALAAAVAALHHVRGDLARGLEPWVASAARAVEAIDAQVPFGLQRAPVQDAVRALVDAFARIVSDIEQRR